MADVAFLLLIFFLVTTSITQLGILDMPLYPKMEGAAQKTPASSTLIFFVNRNNEIMAEKSLVELSMVADIVKTLLVNNKNTPCHIGIQYDPASDYATFASIHSGIRKGLEEARNTFADQEFGLTLHQLDKSEQEKISRYIRVHLYESESNIQ